MTVTDDIAAADRLSDRIVDLLNTERDAMIAEHRLRPFVLLAGLCLALMSLLRSAPPRESKPLKHLEGAVLDWLNFYGAYLGWKDAGES